MSAPSIHDLTLCQWFFYRSGSDLDRVASRAELAPGFRALVEDARQRLGVDFQLREPAHWPTPQTSERLANAAAQDPKDGTERELEARLLLDVVYLQMTQCRKATAPSVLPAIDRWNPPALDQETNRHKYLGEATCLCAEVKGQVTDDLLAALIPGTAQDELTPSTDQSALDAVRLPWGLFTLGSDGDRDTSYLLFDTAHINQATRFVHFLLPQLMLIQVKLRKIVREYQPQLSHVQQQEQALDSLLKQAAQPDLSLEGVERLSADISRRQATFIEGISQLQERLETVKVNVRNLELLLEDPLWGESRQAVRQRLIPGIQLLKEQMETDLRYQQITQEQARYALESLLTVTGVRNTQWERRITLLLGVLAIGFGLMGIAQCVPDEFVAVRLVIVGVSMCGILAGLVCLWWRWS